eukprot:3055612-Pleurochrysis_carterae.AAC.1
MDFKAQREREEKARAKSEARALEQCRFRRADVLTKSPIATRGAARRQPLTSSILSLGSLRLDGLGSKLKTIRGPLLCLHALALPLSV